MSIDTPATVLAPNSLESEQALLGACLTESEVYRELSFLADSHFYYERNRVIFAAMSECHQKNGSFDNITVTEYLRDKQLLEAAGGIAYIIELMAIPYTVVANATSYARIVHEKAIRRQMLDASSKNAQLAIDDSLTLMEVQQQRITNIQREAIAPEQELARYLCDVIEDYFASSQRAMIPTGFEDLDNALEGGFERENLVVVTAPTKGGKSVLMQNMADNMARQGLNIAFFSLEMSEVQLVRRWFMMRTNLSSYKLKDPYLLTEDEKLLLQKAHAELLAYPLRLKAKKNFTLSGLRQQLTGLLADGFVPDVVFWDYLQITKHDGNPSDNREQQIAWTAQNLKAIAEEFNVCIVTGAQVNQAGITRESQSIEFNCDTLLHIVPPEIPPQAKDETYEYFLERQKAAMQQEGKRIIDIRLHRDGAAGMVELGYVPQRLRFGKLVTKKYGD